MTNSLHQPHQATFTCLRSSNIWPSFFISQLFLLCVLHPELNSLKFSGLRKTRESESNQPAKSMKFKRNAWGNAKLLQLIKPKISLIHNLLRSFPRNFVGPSVSSALFSSFLCVLWSATCNYVSYFSSSDVFSSLLLVPSAATERKIFQSAREKQCESVDRQPDGAERRPMLPTANRESTAQAVVLDLPDHRRSLWSSVGLNGSTPPVTLPSIPSQYAWTDATVVEQKPDDESARDLRFLPKVSHARFTDDLFSEEGLILSFSTALNTTA